MIRTQCSGVLGSGWAASPPWTSLGAQMVKNRGAEVVREVMVLLAPRGAPFLLGGGARATEKNRRD